MSESNFVPLIEVLSGLSDTEKAIVERRYIQAETAESTCENLAISRATYEAVISMIVRKLRQGRTTSSAMS